MPRPNETDPELQKLDLMRDFLGDVFPDAVVIVPANVEGKRLRRLDKAGLGLAEVVLPDGTSQFATYPFANTPVTSALDRIYSAEQNGEIPPGSHDRAIDSIINGEFADEWGTYLP